MVGNVDSGLLEGLQGDLHVPVKTGSLGDVNTFGH